MSHKQAKCLRKLIGIPGRDPKALAAMYDMASPALPERLRTTLQAINDERLLRAALGMGHEPLLDIPSILKLQHKRIMRHLGALGKTYQPNGKREVQRRLRQAEAQTYGVYHRLREFAARYPVNVVLRRTLA